MLIIFQAFLGIFISLIILSFNSKNKYLAIFFILNYIHGFVNYTLFFSGNAKLISWVLVNSFPLFYLIGPAFYLYIRGVQTGDDSIKKSDWIHLIPLVIACIITLPYTIQSTETKLQIANDFMRSKDNLLATHQIFTLPLRWHFLLRHIFALFYVVYFGYGFLKSIRKGVIKVSDRAHNWFYFFVIVAILIHVGPVLMIIRSWYVFNFHFGQFMGMVAYSVLGLLLNLSMFLFPEILYGSFLKTVKKDLLVNTKSENTFNQEEIESFEKILATYLVSKPFLDVNFNKSRVMVDLDISDKFFTFYFNEHLGINFNQWKSNLRIDESVRLIESNFLKYQTVESLANQIGFQSRNKFSDAFKKRFGKTPSAYIKGLKK